MHVLLVSARGADRRFGGAERSVELLGDGLRARGHAVTVLAAYPGRRDRAPARVTRYATDPLRDPVRRVHDRLQGFVAAVPCDLDAALRDVDADVVHTHTLPGVGTGVWELARRRRLPVVHTLHDYGLLCARSSLRRRDGAPCDPHPALCGLRRRRLARWAPAVRVVIGVSGHVLARHGGVFDHRSATVVIPPPRLPTAAAAPPGGVLRRLGYAGALTHEKGVDVLIAGAAELARRGVSIAVAGAGPLERDVRAAGLEYAGHLDPPALATFHAAQDAGVVSSVWEEPAVTFAAREWQAAGRPVIASDRGALADLAGEPGVVLFDGTRAGLLHAVAGAREPAGWARLCDAARTPPPGHDLDRWIDAHLAAYARARA